MRQGSTRCGIYARRQWFFRCTRIKLEDYDNVSQNKADALHKKAKSINIVTKIAEIYFVSSLQTRWGMVIAKAKLHMHLQNLPSYWIIHESTGFPICQDRQLNV